MDRSPIRPAGPPLLRVAGPGLVMLALALGVIAGCGGGSSNSNDNAATNDRGATPAPSTPAPSTPAPDTAKAAPAAGGGLSEEALGARVFATRCALCHGPDGHGDGPGAVALNPKPRNYHDRAYMDSRTDDQLLEVIRNGKGSMPKWGAILSEAEIQAVLKHVRGLSKKP